MRARKLSRRAIAISACIALIAAIGAALVATAVLSDEDDAGAGAGAATDQLVLSAPTDVNVDRLLAVALETPDGTTTSLGAMLDGKPLLVNFWQSSCAPCIKEMPLLDAAQADNPNIAFIGVATRDNPLKAAELAEQTGITYPWVLDDDGDLYFEAKGAGMPTTLLIDADGTVLATETGAFADAAELQAFIDGTGGGG